MPLLAMVNTVASADILRILQEYRKEEMKNLDCEKTLGYRAFHQLTIDEKDTVDYIMDELRLTEEEKIVAVIAAQDLQDPAPEPGQFQLN